MVQTTGSSRINDSNKIGDSNRKLRRYADRQICPDHRSTEEGTLSPCQARSSAIGQNLRRRIQRNRCCGALPGKDARSRRRHFDAIEGWPRAMACSCATLAPTGLHASRETSVGQGQYRRW